MNTHPLSQYVAVLWLVPLLPALAGIVTALFPLSWKKPAFALATGALVGSTVTSFWMLYGVWSHPEAVGPAVYNVDWLTFGATTLRIGFLLNPLTVVMISAVTFVSTFIFIYSHGYMHDDRAYARFFTFLSLFSAGMLGLCVSNSLVLLFLSWEVVGVCSYLLIGFWFHKPSAAAAAKKAFIVTKIGDIGFLIGIVWLYKETGTQLLYDAGQGALETSHLQALGAATNVFMGLNMAGVLALLIFCGAVGKSGQFPLHVWLPDAMEGPTPVSALIHAATMVAAGVFLVGRMHPLFAMEPTSLDVVAWLGAFTALFAATIAVAQNDIKRILAYSTVSQLGFMMLGIGTAGVTAGVFHLVTHAFFKALLFLGAGSVIHGSDHEQDIFKMGGLRTSMKTTFATYVIGAAALAGVFPLAGFWSKDEILLGALHVGQARGLVGYVPLAMAMVAAFLTAFYMTRQIALVFFGAPRTHHHAHESPAVMTLPLCVLALFAATIGLLGTPWANGFHHFLQGNRLEPAHPAHANIGFMLVATVISFAGIGAGWWMYGRAPLKAGDVDPLSRMQPLHGWLERRWMFDELYDATIVRLLGAAARATRSVDVVLDGVTNLLALGTRGLSYVAYLVDENVVRKAARGLASGVELSGGVLSRLQSGRVRGSLSFVALGAVLFVILYLAAVIER